MRATALDGVAGSWFSLVQLWTLWVFGEWTNGSRCILSAFPKNKTCAIKVYLYRMCVLPGSCLPRSGADKLWHKSQMCLVHLFVEVKLYRNIPCGMLVACVVCVTAITFQQEYQKLHNQQSQNCSLLHPQLLTWMRKPQNVRRKMELQGKLIQEQKKNYWTTYLIWTWYTFPWIFGRYLLCKGFKIICS